MSTSEPIRLERTYDAGAETIWDLWTTPGGIERWWAPDGFATRVVELDLRPGGALVYEMTATAPEQVAFMENAGMPKTTRSSKTFREIEEPARLTYDSLIDFAPGVEPYEHLTEVELSERDGRTHVVMTIEPLHDEVWTERLVAGRSNELDNLAALLAG